MVNVNETDCGLTEMNETDYGLKEMNDNVTRVEVRLSDDVMMWRKQTLWTYMQYVWGKVEVECYEINCRTDRCFKS